MVEHKLIVGNLALFAYKQALLHSGYGPPKEKSAAQVQAEHAAAHLDHTGTKEQVATCALCNAAHNAQGGAQVVLRGHFATCLRALDNTQVGDRNANKRDSLLCPRTGLTDANVGVTCVVGGIMREYVVPIKRMQVVTQPTSHLVAGHWRTFYRSLLSKYIGGTRYDVTTGQRLTIEPTYDKPIRAFVKYLRNAQTNKPALATALTTLATSMATKLKAN
eukprot:COSAG01_NODE_15955_length_1283_cov_1.205236_2_plen_218_part_01